ncbi:MAG TPA: regulatory iron-sulfur-containing complex subunit RicT, partial [bacterium]|nr:regulatory iron-sulfur-containing complex subunit RicT [bacterium]
RTLGDLDPEERGEVAGQFLRPVGEAEFEALTTLRQDEAAAAEKCRQRVAQHRLPMKVLGADWRYDRTKVTFHFAAEHRVDFRLLVRDLASIYRCRIELHQVGVRDETALYSGMGSCGRELCCHQHLDSFPAVAIKMARLQNLPLNPSKTSGVCGRLKCCLRYEVDVYEELSAALPLIGSRREIDGDPCEVVQHLPLSGLAVVRYDDGRRDTLTPEEWAAGAKAKRAGVRKAYAGSLEH